VAKSTFALAILHSPIFSSGFYVPLLFPCIQGAGAGCGALVSKQLSKDLRTAVVSQLRGRQRPGVDIFSSDRRIGPLLTSVNHAFKHFNVASLENVVPLMVDASPMNLFTVPGSFLRPGA
jgi:uncharacterized LabA/DUF88 family protein